LLLLAVFMLAEVIVAVVSGSLALLSDAGHMLSDVGAIGGALWAIRLAARPAAGSWTFGWKRAEILSAAGNGITLLVVGGIVAVEAISRLIHPPDVAGGPVVAVAAAGIAVNIAVAWVLARANRSNLNVQGAFRRVLTDLYGFIGTVIAGVVILVTGYARADAIASLIVIGLMLKAAWELLRDSGRVLLEAAPENMNLAEVSAHLVATGHVHDVHDLHVWTSAAPGVGQQEQHEREHDYVRRRVRDREPGGVGLHPGQLARRAAQHAAAAVHDDDPAPRPGGGPQHGCQGTRAAPDVNDRATAAGRDGAGQCPRVAVQRRRPVPLIGGRARVIHRGKDPFRSCPVCILVHGHLLTGGHHAATSRPGDDRRPAGDMARVGDGTPER
jgi:cobalt-zinc-cadmium efflux system protein